MGLFSCRPRTTHGRARCARTALGPTEARRRAASSDVRPFAVVLRPRSTSATGELAALLSASGAVGTTSAVLSMGISPVTLFRRSAQWALADCFTLGQDSGRSRAHRQYPQPDVSGRKHRIQRGPAIGSTSVATAIVDSAPARVRAHANGDEGQQRRSSRCATAALLVVLMMQPAGRQCLRRARGV